ncbi:hypothetical protein EV378_2819 [Pseudonocardia endophytica]|uniref:Uncharacterized protein n=1 Tax=Pseudonocardia endophytica TaxID=401976 RepID=A0A4R1HZF9_PSEEN|nr:hypothetical protein EV378_2819 [Pseudonocardia endophytica]
MTTAPATVAVVAVFGDVVVPAAAVRRSRHGIRAAFG